MLHYNKKSIIIFLKHGNLSRNPLEKSPIITAFFQIIRGFREDQLHKIYMSFCAI